MNIKGTYVKTAGVYRCCLGTVGEDYTDEVEIGDKSKCAHCGEKFTLIDDNGKPTWTPDWQLGE